MPRNAGIEEARAGGRADGRGEGGETSQDPPGLKREYEAGGGRELEQGGFDPSRLKAEAEKYTRERRVTRDK
jgi:hypothetical protein